MSRRKLLSTSFMVVALAAMFAEPVQSAPRWRRSNYNYNYGYSSGMTQVATKTDSTSAVYSSVRVYYDYDEAQADEVAFADKLRVFLTVWDQKILSSAEPLVAEVKIADISDYQNTQVRYVPISLADVEGKEYKSAVLDLGNVDGEEPILKPGTVYRLFINLHRESTTYDESTAWGRLTEPYYAVTSGESLIERARHKIVMRTFREWYYTERGWNRNASYPMDCHAYYLWATGKCTVGSRNGWTNLGRVFGTYHHGGHIATLMKEEGIHGDYVRKPGHTFMLLSYDPKMGHVWTMEANFNHTIEICLRSVDSGWTVGHLIEGHIRPDLFGDMAEDATVASDDQTMATTPTVMNPAEATTTTRF